ncbi:hypothetical protein H5410_045083 [Solanum commersonii]|uniref:SWIM-type domain-containing protein n=1 Tax=Solanum commersonii TaxID=4109 RepID=A0A9J5X8K5_SOLCO|nr:hypothetical protein H5410_045083 [Solanum commersonii]
MGVRVYIMLKKAANDFNTYLICISKLDNTNNTTELCESSNQEKDMVRSICIDGIAEFETRQMTIGELVEPLCVLGSGSCDRVISDSCNKYVEVDQVYKVKATLKYVMERYAIEKRFQYRTMRSNAIRIQAFNTDQTCPLKDKVYSQKHTTSMLIGGIVKPKLVVPSTEYIYNVTDDGRSFAVCLKNKTCSCGKFQYEEISCEHAWAVLKRKSLVADGYCLDLYKLMTILKIYEISIYPLPDVAEWVIPEYIMYDEVQPPKFKRPPGRSKKKPRAKTIRELLGLKGKHTCSTCEVVGHNRRSCRNRPQEI